MSTRKFGLATARCPHCDCLAAVMTPDALEVIPDDSLSIVRRIVGFGRTDDRELPVVLPEADRQSYRCPACEETFEPVTRRGSRLRFPG
jgi:hypothetical protein